MFAALREAGMSEEEAKVIAAHADLSQVATKADLAALQVATQSDLAALQVATQSDLESMRRQLARMDGRLSGLYWLMGSIGVVMSLLQGMPLLVPLFS